MLPQVNIDNFKFRPLNFFNSLAQLLNSILKLLYIVIVCVHCKELSLFRCNLQYEKKAL